MLKKETEVMKPGDIVYDIPQPPNLRAPRRYFLKCEGLYDKIIAINSSSRECVFNPKLFCTTKEEAREAAIELWSSWLADATWTAVNAMLCHDASLYP